MSQAESKGEIIRLLNLRAINEIGLTIKFETACFLLIVESQGTGFVRPDGDFP